MNEKNEVMTSIDEDLVEMGIDLGNTQSPRKEEREEGPRQTEVSEEPFFEPPEGSFVDEVPEVVAEEFTESGTHTRGGRKKGKKNAPMAGRTKDVHVNLYLPRKHYCVLKHHCMLKGVTMKDYFVAMLEKDLLPQYRDFLEVINKSVRNL